MLLALSLGELRQLLYTVQSIYSTYVGRLLTHYHLSKLT